MSRAPSPHMVLALQAGLVSQELLGALTAVDDEERNESAVGEISRARADASNCASSTRT